MTNLSSRRSVIRDRGNSWAAIRGTSNSWSAIRDRTSRRRHCALMCIPGWQDGGSFSTWFIVFFGTRRLGTVWKVRVLSNLERVLNPVSNSLDIYSQLFIDVYIKYVG